LLVLVVHCTSTICVDNYCYSLFYWIFFLVLLKNV